MMSLEEEITKYLDLSEAGVPMQVTRGTDGNYIGVVPPEPVPNGIRARGEELVEPRQSMFRFSPPDSERRDYSVGELPEAVGRATAGAATGVFGTIAGLPGDVAGLIKGGYDAARAEDGERLEAFLTGLTEVSETMGSAAFEREAFEAIDVLPMTMQEKRDMKDAVKAGLLTGYIFPSKAAAGAAPQVARQIKKGMPQGDPELGAIGLDVGKVKETDLKKILDIRAQEMDKKIADRIQPSGENPMFDTSPEAYQANLPEQSEVYVPRAPEGKSLPKFNRAKSVADASDEIVDILVEKMRPFLGTAAQYFYNTGPIIAKAVELGIPEDVARQQLKKFALNYAATSPRTMTEQNLRNASLVAAKDAQGIDLLKVVGPGGTGVNEKGYPMMINPGGIHKQLIEDVKAGGINPDKNPKPYTFAENVSGNLQGVTVDTHAIRGALLAMNEANPGSIPEGWFLKTVKGKETGFYEQYKKDPSSFDAATMVDDTLGSQKINGKSMQTEYAVFSDIYKKAAEKLGVSPAEAQSLGWFGSGDKTGLASETKSVVELLDERIDVTAQGTGMPKDEVFKKFMGGEIPLLSLGGLTLLETGAEMENDDGAVR